MKKYAILALIAGLFIAQQAGAMFGGGSSNGEINLASSESTLKAALYDAQSAQEQYMVKAQKFVNGVRNNTGDTLSDALDVLSGLKDKLETNTEKLQSAASATAALDAIGVILTTGKQIGTKYTEYINAFLDDILRPLADATMITDASIKGKIDTNADALAKSIEALKKAFPAQIKPRGPNSLESTYNANDGVVKNNSSSWSSTFSSVGTELGKGLASIGAEVGKSILPEITSGLIALITGKPQAVPLTEEQKLQIINNVKATKVAIEKVKDIINDAAKTASTELNKAKNIDLDIVADVKKEFAIFSDPEYTKTQNSFKFSTLVTASNKLFELVTQLGTTLKSVNAAAIKFVAATYGDSSDDALSSLQSIASKFNKMIDGMNNSFETVKEEIGHAKNKFSTTSSGSTLSGSTSNSGFSSGTSTGGLSGSTFGGGFSSNNNQQQPKTEAKTKPTHVWELTGEPVTNPIQGKKYIDSNNNVITWTW